MIAPQILQTVAQLEDSHEVGGIIRGCTPLALQKNSFGSIDCEEPAQSHSNLPDKPTTTVAEYQCYDAQIQACEREISRLKARFSVLEEERQATHIALMKERKSLQELSDKVLLLARDLQKAIFDFRYSSPKYLVAPDEQNSSVLPPGGHAT
ncbi:hypothetical protein TWF718_009687 [Orbilia javanica]|uniref:Uncharacterized protein n=1 Tax=Orbilia javanica TaxID=47235 RepID=A0AAN8MWJ3_9PEZI